MISYFNLPIEIYYDTDTYIAECTSIQWAFAEWESPEEAIANLKEVVLMIQSYENNNNICDAYLVTSKRITTNLPLMK